MCGRYVLHGPYAGRDPEWEADWRSFLPAALGTTARYNIAPTQDLPVVMLEGGAPAVQTLRWGLIPHWARDVKMAFSTINARAEGLMEKPAYRDAWRAGQRCLVPATGWYEWRLLPGGRKQACYFHASDTRNPMMLAGLWSDWRGPQGERVRSYTIITTESLDIVAEVHDRQPRVLATRDWLPWLTAGVGEARHWLAAESIPVAWHPVGAAVGNVRQDHSGLIAPLDEEAAAPRNGELW
ncbi:MAG: SOS response-associated peptidase [Gammaproteobacteria bacterium]|nr:SOS response-associated peptidase [Gammaproteobacteria bacterium]